MRAAGRRIVAVLALTFSGAALLATGFEALAGGAALLATGWPLYAWQRRRPSIS